MFVSDIVPLMVSPSEKQLVKVTVIEAGLVSVGSLSIWNCPRAPTGGGSQATGWFKLRGAKLFAIGVRAPVPASCCRRSGSTPRILGRSLGFAESGTSPMVDEPLAPTDTKETDRLNTSTVTGSMLAALSARRVVGAGPDGPLGPPPPPPPPPHDASAVMAVDKTSSLAACGTWAFIPLSVDDINEGGPA